jgi:hypothetical protein
MGDKLIKSRISPTVSNGSTNKKPEKGTIGTEGVKVPRNPISGDPAVPSPLAFYFPFSLETENPPSDRSWTYRSILPSFSLTTLKSRRT